MQKIRTKRGMGIWMQRQRSLYVSENH